MSKNKPNRPDIFALHAEAGLRLGKGQDNLVNQLVVPPEAEALVASGRWVVKVSHRGHASEKKRDPSLDSAESAAIGTIYKKKKYELLKHFLGSNVPDSLFLASTVNTDGRPRAAEIILQQRVPNITIDQLTAEQREDPRLRTNVLDLFYKLRYMYSVIGEANGRASQGAMIDGKIDLGGVSDFARSRTPDQGFSMEDAERAVRTVHSPNLLVDPETMNLFCIDYDQGDWNEGMDATRQLAFDIDAERRSTAAEVSSLAMNGLITRGYVQVAPPPVESRQPSLF